MAPRGYGQYCGFARALELVGERWTLLIVRDLLVGPRRFSDLERALAGIPTNILAARLKELEASGLVLRRALPAPERAVVYELTAYGRELEDAIVALGRWGAKSLGDPRPGEVVTAESLVTALRSTFHREAARGLHAGFELRFGEIVIHARVDDGAVEAAIGPLREPDLVIETGPALKALMSGDLAPARAIREGSVTLRGDRALLTRFVQIFRIESLPAA
ncbi:MAG TPA: helix-turn-helix domain-containing protein [Candidatus Limnocylindria bacterium]|jgi:DNA-binding HxlR family transcriptional regulator|nr:helix-turn-helix domain-containing protein [Candidatus Limnocylindria bacterium]